MKTVINTVYVVALALSTVACQNFSSHEVSDRAHQLSAEEFIEQANSELALAAKNASHAAWWSSPYLNLDSQAVFAKASQEHKQSAVQDAKQAASEDKAVYYTKVAHQLQRMK